MKLLNILAIATAAIVLTSCGSNNKTEQAADEQTVLTVDDVLAEPDNYVDQTITMEGICSHLCKHGGRKAFIVGNTANNMIRCESTPEMGGAFPATTIHHPLVVTGVLRETRIGEEEVREMERQQAARIAQAAEQGVEDAATVADESDTAAGCETEKAARGQADLNSFSARMADYRARIAQRDSLESKPYLSFYYLETTAYKVAE